MRLLLTKIINSMRIDPDKIDIEKEAMLNQKADAIKQKVAVWVCFAGVFVFFFKILFF